jgi:hypothetical protein
MPARVIIKPGQVNLGLNMMSKIQKDKPMRIYTRGKTG